MGVDIADQMSTVPYKMATQDDLDETVKGIEAYDRRALAIKADVRDKRQLDEAVSRGIAEFGKIDILVANAGIWTQAPFWELTDDQWDQMIGVNLTDSPVRHPLQLGQPRCDQDADDRPPGRLGHVRRARGRHRPARLTPPLLVSTR